MTKQRATDRDRDFVTLMRSVHAGDNAAYSRLLREITPLLRNAVRHSHAVSPPGWAVWRRPGWGNFGLRLFHPQDASLMVLVWQVGTVFVLMMLAGCSGRRVLN